MMPSMQVVLGNASPSLTSLVSQGLRQSSIVPSVLFGPEGNFSSGPQIIQAIARLLGPNQSSPTTLQPTFGGTSLAVESPIAQPAALTSVGEAVGTSIDY